MMDFLVLFPPPFSPVTRSGPAAGSPPFPSPEGVLVEPSAAEADQDPVLCSHCGRTASNGISCQGICVADSGY